MRFLDTVLSISGTKHTVAHDLVFRLLEAPFFGKSQKRTWEFFRIHKKAEFFLTLNLVYSWWYQYHRSTDLRFSQRMAHAWAYFEHHLLRKQTGDLHDTVATEFSLFFSPIRSLWILASKFPNQNHERWFMKPGHSSVQYRTRKTSLSLLDYSDQWKTWNNV